MSAVFKVKKGILANELGERKPRSSVSLLLIALFLIALVLRVEVPAHFPSIEWPDEIYNTLEPAHHLAYGYGVVVWEWREGVRSWVFPTLLAAVMRATDWMGPGSVGYLRAITVILSLLSLTTVWFAYHWGRRTCGESAGFIAAGACAIWYQMVYFAPKAFTEVVAGNILLPGLYLGMYGEELPEKKRLFLAGLFCGLAVSLRMQLTPAVAFATYYFCRTNWRRRTAPVLAGLLLPVVAFGLVDAITWSYPFQSFLRYFWVVVVEGRGSTFGTEPWYWYLLLLARSFGPLLLLALVGVRRSPFLGWVALIIVASHSVFAHKEPRFIYPVIPIIVTLAALGFVELAAALSTRRKLALSPKVTVVAGLVFFALTSGFLAWRFPRWRHNSGGLIAMDRLSQDSSVCGVGLPSPLLLHSGGYTHLHRNVPIILINPNIALEEQVPGFNAFLTFGRFNDQKFGFEPVGCWNGICLYRRAGSCSASSQYNEVNKVLQESGN
ncbi:MAG: hypothetical protein ABSC64_04210 [Candidatus Korobacteraceae bacterium]|jgi:hypothetical protein